MLELTTAQPWNLARIYHYPVPAHGIEYELGSAQEPWPYHSLQLRTWCNGNPLVCENTKVVRIIFEPSAAL